jgi:hypothetical protein
MGIEVRKATCFLFIGVAACLTGCSGESAGIVGRWTSPTSTYFFRNDGVVFYQAGDVKYSGPYSLDATTEPAVVTLKVDPINASAQTIWRQFHVEFTTPERMKLQLLTRDGSVDETREAGLYKRFHGVTDGGTAVP